MVRRLRGVILEGEENEMGYTRWPKATHRGRRSPAREASVPAPQGPRRRAAEQLELLVNYKLKIMYVLTKNVNTMTMVLDHQEKAFDTGASQSLYHINTTSPVQCRP